MIVMPARVGGMLLGFAVLVLGGPAPRDDGRRDDPLVESEMRRLQGIWTLDSMEIDGRPASEEQTRGWILVIEGDQYNPGSGQTSVEYTFRIDPHRNPKGIDLVPHDGTHRGRTLRGVYEIRGETLVICRVRFPEGERPAGFATRIESGLVTTVWKRRKP